VEFGLDSIDQSRVLAAVLAGMTVPEVSLRPAAAALARRRQQSLSTPWRSLTGRQRATVGAALLVWIAVIVGFSVARSEPLAWGLFQLVVEVAVLAVILRWSLRIGRTAAERAEHANASQRSTDDVSS